jgi:hypothetical protein
LFIKGNSYGRSRPNVPKRVPSPWACHSVVLAVGYQIFSHKDADGVARGRCRGARHWPQFRDTREIVRNHILAPSNAIGSGPSHRNAEERPSLARNLKTVFP